MTHRNDSIEPHDSRQAFAPVLRQEILLRIHELNSDYLELLAIERAGAECAGQLQFFTPKVQAALAEISFEHRARLAAAPYALYSLRFEDPRFWQTACDTAHRRIDERYAAAPDGGSLRGLFIEIALMQAWHIASTHPLAARMIYSMSESVRERVAALSLWQVKQIVGEHAKIMTPRWPHNPCFWPDLIAFAKASDSVRLAATQLLGTQLIAAELAATSRANRVGRN